MTVDEWVGARNEIQFKAEPLGDIIADECWVRLGVCTRHINRIIAGDLPLVPAVEDEMRRCLEDARRWLESRDGVGGSACSGA